MSVETNKLIKRREHRKRLKTNRNKIKQVTVYGVLQKKVISKGINNYRPKKK